MWEAREGQRVGPPGCPRRMRLLDEMTRKLRPGRGLSARAALMSVCAFTFVIFGTTAPYPGARVRPGEDRLDAELFDTDRHVLDGYVDPRAERLAPSQVAISGGAEPQGRKRAAMRLRNRSLDGEDG